MHPAVALTGERSATWCATVARSSRPEACHNSCTSKPLLTLKVDVKIGPEMRTDFRHPNTDVNDDPPFVAKALNTRARFRCWAPLLLLVPEPMPGKIVPTGGMRNAIHPKEVMHQETGSTPLAVTGCNCFDTVPVYQLEGQDTASIEVDRLQTGLMCFFPPEVVLKCVAPLRSAPISPALSSHPSSLFGACKCPDGHWHIMFWWGDRWATIAGPILAHFPAQVLDEPSVDS